MTTTELYQSVIGHLPIKEIHPLHKAMMEECCETALQNKQGVVDKKTLILSVQIAFMTCNTTLKSTLNASLKMANADQVTLNYRGQTFIISKSSNLLK